MEPSRRVTHSTSSNHTLSDLEGSPKRLSSDEPQQLTTPPPAFRAATKASRARA